MNRGVGASIAVFAGVLVVVAGLGWLVYEAGRTEVDPTAPAAPRPNPHIPRNRPGPEIAPPNPPARATLPTSPEEMAHFVFPGKEWVKLRNWKEIAAAYVEWAADMRDVALNGRPNQDDEAQNRKRGEVAKRYTTATSETPNGPDGLPIIVDKSSTVEPIERPAFATNLVAALLDAAKMPITEDQGRRIEALGRARAEEADRGPMGPTEDDGVTYALDQIATRAEAIDRFFTSFWEILTPAQSQYVSPAEYRYHCGVDLLCSGRVMQIVALPVPYSDVDQLVQSVTDHLAGQLEATDRRDELRPIVDTWARRDPLEPLDPLERKGRVPLYSCRRLIRDAHLTVELLHNVADGMKLSPETAKKARQMHIAYIPIPK